MKPKKKPSASSRNRVTAFVPRAVLQAAFATVIPAVAAMQSGCGQAIGPADASDHQSPPNDQQIIALAMIGFDAEAGTPDATPDVRDVQQPPDQQIIALAMIGFDAEAGTDASMGVADVSFGGG